MPIDGTSDHGRAQRGSNLPAVGQYNERLILQLIRRAGSLPKADIARMTRLSAQTVSVIINRLLRDRLLRKQPRRREKGKLGQPAVPIALNPGGAYSIGIKIGRRSLDSLLIDFTGDVLQRYRHHYAYPDPDQAFALIDRDIAALVAALGAAQRRRIVGVGVVAPYARGGWQRTQDAPPGVLARWSGVDIGRRLAERQTLPVWFSNDATAACLAELEFGNAARFDHFLYFFVGALIGGGVVLNGTLHAGAHGNAGALGSMPLPARYAGAAAADGVDADAPVRLIHCASRYLLDDRLAALEVDPDRAIAAVAASADGVDPAVSRAVCDWSGRSAAAIAYAAAAAASVMDFEGVIIDGALPPRCVEQLTGAVERGFARIDLEGLARPRLAAGRIGNDARALGGAILPFYASFAPGREVLLKLGETAQADGRAVPLSS